MRLIKKQKPRIFRHGDILLREIDSIPNEAVKVETDILAAGEKTGHHHRLRGSFQMYELENSKNETRFLEISKKTQLTHEEHKKLGLPKVNSKLGDLPHALQYRLFHRRHINS